MVKSYFFTVLLSLSKGTIRLVFAKDICIMAYTLSQADYAERKNTCICYLDPN